MTVWIWSDLHLWHKNIIAYEERPFDTVEDMNQEIANNWKTLVGKNDIIFNLGDVSFTNKEITSKFIQDMPGQKYLILGNHDRARTVSWWRDVGFDFVSPYPIIYEGFYILSHESVYINSKMPYVNIYGHSHREKTNNPRKLNICVENFSYKPVNFEDIKQHFVNLEGKTNE